MVNYHALHIYLNTSFRNRISMYAKTMLVLTIITTLLLASLGTAGMGSPLAIATQGQKFTAKLTGQNEVPPTNTKATGSLEMELSPDGAISHYVLNVTDISNVISAQIHEGANGNNGPFIVTLFMGAMNGSYSPRILSQGTVYSDLFEGPFAGKHLSDLITLINSGMAYVDVSTKQHPQGEIRGQLSSVTSGAAPPPAAASAPAAPSHGQKFIAKLTGYNQVPPINTKAAGNFEIELSPDGTISNYVLNVTNISNVTLAHIHEGEKGINGPIIFTLYKSTNPKGEINGMISKGKVYSNLLEGPLAGKYISDLIDLINQGNAYVNVHTKQNPQGEIRGQLSATK
jgi:hypothetical protein